MPRQRRTDLSASAASDEALLAAIQARDAAALTALYDRYGRLAFGLASHVLGERGAAEATVQEAFLTVWRRAGGFQSGPTTPRAWLLAIVHTLAVDRRRGRSRPDVGGERLDDERPTQEVSADTAATGGRSVEPVAVRAALEALPAEQRAAIELAYLGGLTDDEIAERTGTSSDIVRSRLRLGLHGLRGHLFPDEEPAMGPETTPGAESP